MVGALPNHASLVLALGFFLRNRLIPYRLSPCSLVLPRSDGGNLETDLHLLNSARVSGIEFILETCNPRLREQPRTTIAYMPARITAPFLYYPYIQAAFAALAKIVLIDVETVSLSQLATVLQGTQVILLSRGYRGNGNS